MLPTSPFERDDDQRGGSKVDLAVLRQLLAFMTTGIGCGVTEVMVQGRRNLGKRDNCDSMGRE